MSSAGAERVRPRGDDAICEVSADGPAVSRGTRGVGRGATTYSCGGRARAGARSAPIHPGRERWTFAANHNGAPQPRRMLPPRVSRGTAGLGNLWNAPRRRSKGCLEMHILRGPCTGGLRIGDHGATREVRRRAAGHVGHRGDLRPGPRVTRGRADDHGRARALPGTLVGSSVPVLPRAHGEYLV
jgi:hypothetical protein